MNFGKLDRTWIVAEIGVNHEGDQAVAENLIRLAAKAGVDAVKFQTFEAEHYISSEQVERFKRAKRFQLPFEGFRRLAEVAKSEKVIFFSTPLSLSDIDNLDEIQPIFKISSGDLTFLELIRYAAGKGKPMIISTGLGTEDEISAAVEVVLKVRPTAREDGSLMLMHCICAYPTPAEEANLRSIDYLRDRFGLPVGYSDHTIGIKASELAVASGAVTIEKHFTYRKEDQIFHDHKLSANPDDMRDLVESIRLAEKYLGRKHRIRSKSEESMLLHMRRSIGTVVDIPAGVAVRREWLTWLRPAWGIGPDDMGLVEGKRLNKPLKAGAIVRAEDVEA